MEHRLHTYGKKKPIFKTCVWKVTRLNKFITFSQMSWFKTSLFSCAQDTTEELCASELPLGEIAPSSGHPYLDTGDAVSRRLRS